MAFTVADKRKAPSEHAAIGIGREQLPGATKPLYAAVPHDPEGASCPIAETGRLFLASVDTMRQKPRRQARCHSRQMHVMDLSIRTQCARQPAAAGIEPLAWDGQQFIECGHSACQQAKFLAMPFDVALPAGKLAGTKISK